MNKIAYILGAGFSAPAGLPLMNNFILKANDLYYAKPEEYNYFIKIFQKIDQLAKIKNFFSCDLYNIEEVLSIFETQAILEKDYRLRKAFTRFIIDVIDHYTLKPYHIKPELPASNYYISVLQGGSGLHSLYTAFICNIFGVVLKKQSLGGKDFELRVERIPNHNVRYSIITLNYDTIPENCFDSVKSAYEVLPSIGFKRNTYDNEWKSPHLVKLHGCIKSGEIIPPTWSKRASNTIVDSWKVAYDVIKDATEIRILGYSLPITDTNVRYLIKSAILKNTRLHQIDVISLDNSERQLEKNYRGFIDFNYFKFSNFNIIDYLKDIRESSLALHVQKDGVYFNTMEHIHRQVMGR